MKKVFLFLTMLLFAFVGTMRADVLTVGDGTVTNDRVPVYGYNGDTKGNQSEFVIPADQLTAMAGCEITKMTFYLSTSAAAAWTATFQVYMTEIEETTLSAMVGPAGCTQVYEGTLDATGSTMVIEFDESYIYGGGNLVVGTYIAVKGNWKSAQFYGVTATGASINKPSATGSVSQRNFLPKTTFEYAVPPTCPKPTQLAVAYEGGTTATVTWNHEAETFNLKVNDEVIEGVTSPYAMENLELATVYDVQVQAVCTPEDSSEWTNPVSFVTDLCLEEDMCELTFELTDSYGDGWNGAAIQVYDVATATLIGELTNQNVAKGDPETEIYTLPVCDGREIAFVWKAGSFDTECSYVVKDVNNIVIFDGAGAMAEPIMHTVSCAELGAYVVVSPNPMDLGYRPNNAWMEPAQLLLDNWGKPVTVSTMVCDNNYFQFDVETPFNMNHADSLYVDVTTGNGKAGEQNGSIFMVYNESRESNIIAVTATAYDPAEGDVYEKAIEVEEFPFAGTAPDSTFKNYNIPGAAATAGDVMYKVTFDEDVMLTATAAGGVTALYPEDFNGEEGPMAKNNYKYNGPSINPSPMDTWFEGYEYTGANTFFGSSAGGGIYFGYKVTPAMLNGYGYCYMTAVESAAREAYAYDLYVFRGGNNPAQGKLIYSQEMEQTPEPMYFFHMDIDEPFEIGEEENLWVMFYSESPYAAYCGKNPVDENGLIWYSFNGTTWNSSSTYSFTPIIYFHMVYPNGQKVVYNPTNGSIKEINNTNAILAEAKGQVEMPSHDGIVAKSAAQRGGFSGMYVPAGTYYVAAASETANFAVNMETAAAPSPVAATIVKPLDGAHNVKNGDMFQWTIGNYTNEFQILLGTEFPPQTVYVDWTDFLYQSMAFEGLENNKIYFMQINERNSAGVTESEIIGFTSEITPVVGFAVESAELYPGEAAVFTWEANRSIKGYNLYMDGVKVNETLITGSTYAVDSLAYNMTEEGYAFQITAVYDEGESEPSDPIVVNMTGYGIVNGTVYEQDSITPVPFATVLLNGVDEYGEDQTFVFSTDENGEYTGEIYAGMYTAYGMKEGYQECEGDDALIIYGEETDDVNVIMYEMYYPLGQIDAVEVEGGVEVTWSWTPANYEIDFEDGEFPAEFSSTSTYPWAITTVNPHEGTYCMKSACEGVNSGVSFVEATVDVPFDGKMGFWVRVSSENNYDKFHFYIDDVEKGAAISGQQAYAYKEYPVTEGTHTYKWEYAKDSSVNSNDDCVYVDDITMYRKVEPTPPGQGQWYQYGGDELGTSIGASGAFYWGVMFPAGSYQGNTVTKAAMHSSSGRPFTGSVTVYNDGTTAPSAAVGTMPISVAGTETWEEFEFASPLTIDPSKNLWIIFYNESSTDYVAGACVDAGDANARWVSLDGSTWQDLAGAGVTGYSWMVKAYVMQAAKGEVTEISVPVMPCENAGVLTMNPEKATRALVNFNLYRKNVINDNIELIGVFNDTTFSYLDEDFEDLTYGMYQWGIQAQYEGNAVPQNRGGREEIVIGTNDYQYNYSPVNAYFNYSLTEQIYTAQEIGTAGTINAVSFYAVNNSAVRDINVYMVNTTKSEYDANNDWILVTAADLVYSGTKEFVTDDWTTITLDTPFAYDGTSNLAIIVDDNSGQYSFSYPSFAMYDTDLDATLAYANDNTNADPTSVTVSGTIYGRKNQIKLDIEGSGPSPVPAGDGLSEIIWSQVIDKDMESVAVVEVELNNGQSAEGAVVMFEGSEQYTGTVDAEGVAEIELRKGAYTLTITLDGYTSIEEAVVIDADIEEFEYTLEEIKAPVENLVVGPTGYAMWDAEAPTPNPNPNPQGGTTYGFEASEEGWTSIDADGDGYEWYNLNPTNMTTTIPGHNGSAGHMTSASYQSVALTPDNYLVSPAKAAYTQISFWACGQDASWAAEHFGVAVSTTNNTSASAFTTIQEWTMTAKEGPKGARGMNAQGTWYEYTVDLGAYAGQDIWVAIRHFNCTDMFRINVDDVTLSTAAKADRTPVSYNVKLDGQYVGETTGNYFQHNTTGFEVGSTHVTAVAAVYATGESTYVEYTWTYADCDDYAGATSFTGAAANGNVTLNWTFNGTPTPPTPPTPGVLFEDDFEDGNLTNWTTIDADGDGDSWVNATPAAYGIGDAHSGTNCASSWSWNNYSIDPDNYMVSPLVEGATSIEYYVATNTGYPDHYGIFASSTGTSAGNFTLVFEETAGSKGTAGVKSSTTRPGTRDMSAWIEKTVELPAGTKYVAFRHYDSYDMNYLFIDDVTIYGSRGNRAMWDLVYEFDGTSGYQYGVATDGNNIYTSSWSASSTSMFYKYDMQGNFIEEFNISGCGQLRGMTYDGEYFYGVANSSTVYCVDLANHSLVSQFTTTYGAMRCITYDPQRDGFWVVGNWSGNLTLISRTGAIVQAATAPESASDVADWKDSDNVEHVLYLKNESNYGKVYEYNITTNTMGTTPLFDCASSIAWGTGSSGGCFVATYSGKTCFFVDEQASPQHIAIFELEDGSGPTPPQPVGNILGVNVYRNGELIALMAPSNAPYVDSNLEEGTYEYCIQAVYDDYGLSCEQ